MLGIPSIPLSQTLIGCSILRVLSTASLLVNLEATLNIPHTLLRWSISFPAVQPVHIASGGEFGCRRFCKHGACNLICLAKDYKRGDCEDNKCMCFPANQNPNANGTIPGETTSTGYYQRSSRYCSVALITYDTSREKSFSFVDVLKFE